MKPWNDGMVREIHIHRQLIPIAAVNHGSQVSVVSMSVLDSTHDLEQRRLTETWVACTSLMWRRSRTFRRREEKAKLSIIDDIRVDVHSHIYEHCPYNNQVFRSLLWACVLSNRMN